VTSRVYRITVDGKVSDAVTPSRRNLVMNGVIRTGHHHLMVVDMFYGNVTDVDLRDNRKTVIGTGFRAADGVDQSRNGTIFVASFDNGAVWSMDRDGENPKLLLQGLGRSSTADLMLDEPGKRLLVADTLHGTVIIIPLA
jgi:hypothetical protein